MSVKIIQEPIYNQIKDTNNGFANNTITAIANSVAAGTTVVGHNSTALFMDFDGAVALDITSSSANDTNTGSATGAKRLKVEGLFCDTSDLNHYKPRTALFNMNGTSNATLYSGVNLFSVVNKVSVISNGTNNHNEGNIFVKQTGTANLAGFIRATESQSHTFMKGVGHSNTLLIKDIHISAFCQTGCVIKIYKQSLISGMKYLESQILINDSTPHIIHQINLKIEGNNVVYAEITNLETVTGNNFITMNCSSLLI